MDEVPFLYHVLFVWSCLFSTHIFLEGRCSSAKSIQWKFPPVYCCLCRPPLLLQYQWIMYDLLFSSCLVFDKPFCCRYTFFIVLYPMGVTGELLTIYAALPYVQKTGLYSVTLPNKYNFSFDYYTFLILIMISYIPRKSTCRFFLFFPPLVATINRIYWW